MVTNSMTDLISVVVPVYKVENYLRRCIDSINNQTYKNIEIILINDGSPDKCPDICNEYAKRYPNIFVIHQNNLGLSAARNIGIDRAKGTYITFVDSDDFIHPRFLEELKNDIDKYKASLATCCYLKFYGIDDNSIENSTDKEVFLINDEQAMNMLFDNQSYCTAWGKLYDIKLFDNLRYPVGKICEDMFIIPYVFNLAKKIVVDSQILYFYNQEGLSITRSAFNYNKLDMIEALCFWKQFVDKFYRKLSEKAQILYLTNVIDVCGYLIKINDQQGNNVFNKYKKELLENFDYFIKSRFSRRNDIIKAYLIKFNLFKIFVTLIYR